MFRTARVGSVEELLLGRVSSIEGMLWKKGKGAGALGRRNWKMRFFVLIASRDGAEDSGLFYFDKAPAGADLGKPLGAVLLDQPDAVAARVFDGDLSSAEDAQGWYRFAVRDAANGERLFAASSEADREAWIAAINAAIAAKTAGAGDGDGDDDERVASRAKLEAQMQALALGEDAGDGAALVATAENTFEIEVPAGKLGLIVIENQANNGARHVIAGFRAKSPLLGKVHEGDHIAGVAVKGGSSVDTLAYDHEKLSSYLMGLADEPRVITILRPSAGVSAAAAAATAAAAAAADGADEEAEPGNPWEAMSIKDLKAEMTSMGISTEGIVEKREMIEALVAYAASVEAKRQKEEGPRPRGRGMGFTEEQMRACVLDGGTRFVAPGQVTYDEDGLINKVSDERASCRRSSST